MIVRVYGKCNGADIIFEPIGRRWKALVPSQAQGQYVVELHADDDAGNSAYMATVLFTVDISKLQFDVRILNIGVMYSVEEITSIFGMSKYQVSAVTTNYRPSASIKRYNASVEVE